MRTHLHAVAGLLFLAAVTAPMVILPGDAGAQPCEICKHDVGECKGTGTRSVCFAGENPDGSPFCADHDRDCNAQTTSLDLGAAGLPLANVPGSLYASSVQDVRRSCDRVVLRHVLHQEDATAATTTTAHIVI